MGRRDYEYSSTRFVGGLNESTDDASFDECSDCDNVWRPGSVLETRPGYTGHAFVGNGDGTTTVLKAAAEINGVFSGPDGGGVLDLSGMVKNRDRWYLGHTSAWGSALVIVPAPNSNATFVSAEYWNGSAWVHVNVQYSNNLYYANSHHLSGTYIAVALCPPEDWASTSVNSTTAYWVRFNILGADLDAAVTVDVNHANTLLFASSVLRGWYVAQYPSTKKTSAVAQMTINGTYGWFVTGAAITPTDTTVGTPATFAVVPQFGESYIAYKHSVVRSYADDDLTNALATVEDRDFAVGPGAPYDGAFVAQLNTWPKANFILFFGNRLWAAGLEGEPYTIRWSAAAPYHRVWVALSFEFLMEDDNSPITALTALGEQVVVFKQDSIWIMVDVGENPATGVTAFVPRRIVSGVGCVAPHSVSAVGGELIFLSEDGLYAFNGSPTVRKITERNGVDRLEKAMASMSQTRRHMATAVNWKERSCYIISFSTNGYSNDTTIVWDYAADALWKWSNVEAELWFIDERLGDITQVYFATIDGCVYRFGNSVTDDGAAISSYVDTEPLGLDDDITMRARAVNVLSDNRSRSLTISATPDDTSATTSTVDLTDHTEADWDDFSWASGAATDDSWVPDRRRKRREGIKEENEWMTVRVAHSTKYSRMRLTRLDVGQVRMGRR